MKKLFITCLCVLVLLGIAPSKAYADMGPKASVHIEFKDIEGKYYVTLLSNTMSTGPYHTRESGDTYGNDEIGDKFNEYAKHDNYYYLDYYQECTDTDLFEWTYFPPENFKVLIYLADEDQYIVTQPYERYAFHSYYVFDSFTRTLKENYDYTWEIVSFLVRMVLTIIVELLVALMFGFGDKKKLIIITNIITQGILNLYINIVNHYGGFLTVLLTVFLVELGVIIIESIIYAIGIRRKKTFIYALVANIVSFGAGLIATVLIPGFF